MLTNYCQKITGKYRGDVMKLIPNLGDKTNYVLHYRNRQLYFSLGMKLTKIHRVLMFKQSNWMKKYIHFNTEKRTNAASNFEKTSILFITKTMENSRKSQISKQ